MKKFDKPITVIFLSLLLLFGIALKSCLLFYMSEELVFIKNYIYHKWLNFALDSVAVFIGFYFIIKRVKTTWKQVVLAFVASAYTYICVMAENLMLTYRFYSVWGGYESEPIFVPFDGMAAELKQCIFDNSFMYLRTFVLLTLILCVFAILLQKRNNENKNEQPFVSNRFIWVALSVMLVINCYLKAWVHLNCSYDVPVRFAEILNYIFDAEIMLLLFEVLNTKIKEIATKIISAIVLMIFTVRIIMAENIEYLYLVNYGYCYENGLSKNQYIFDNFISFVADSAFKYVIVAIVFAIACAVIIICNIPKIKAKLIIASNAICDILSVRFDEDMLDISTDDDDGRKFVRAKKISSIHINGDEQEDIIIVYKNKRKPIYYLCQFDNDGFYTDDILIFNNAREMYEGYARKIAETAKQDKV